MADAQYDYAAVVPVSETVLYALRRSYDQALPRSRFGRLSRAFRGFFSGGAGLEAEAVQSFELVRITAKGSELVARDVSPSTSQRTRTSSTRTGSVYSESLHVRRRPSRCWLSSASNSWSFTGDLARRARGAGRSTVVTVSERSSGPAGCA